jgi:hypothetical protein
MFGLADAGSKPLSSAKVKRRRGMTAAWRYRTLCETDHIADQYHRRRKRQCKNEAAIKLTGCGALDTPLSRGMTVMSGREAGYMRESIVG